MTIFELNESLLESLGKLRNCKEGEYLLQEGEVATSAFYILSGALRLFFDSGEAEITLEFFFERSMVASIASFTKGVQSEFSVQTIEASSIIEIPRQNLEKYLTSAPEVETELRNTLEARIIYYVNRLRSFLSLTAEERYEELVNKFPQIIHRVKQKYIASFIGIRPESLSRIRKERTRS